MLSKLIEGFKFYPDNFFQQVNYQNVLRMCRKRRHFPFNVRLQRFQIALMFAVVAVWHRSFLRSIFRSYISFHFVAQAFYNEMKCIFRNRLTTDRHKDQFDTILANACRNLFDIDELNHFFVPSGSQSTALQYTSQQDWTDIVKRNITICSMFLNWINFKTWLLHKTTSISVNLLYFSKKTNNISDTEDIAMHTVVSELLLDTISSICRTLARNETHILVAGPTGSIKFDALHIACTHLGIKIASITPVKNYNIHDFYNDLKMVINHQFSAI